MANIDVAFTSMRALKQTDDGGDSDEPYAILATVDVEGGPHVRVVRTPVFGDVDTGEVRTHHVPMWGLHQQPAPMHSPGTVFFLVALLENDGGDPDEIRATVEAEMKRQLSPPFLQPGIGITLKALFPGFTVAVENARQDSTTFWDGYNLDDRIGPVHGFQVTLDELNEVEHHPHRS